MALPVAQRLQDLSDNIQQSEILLKSFEDALRLEEDPRRRMRYSQEIHHVKVAIDAYRQEYRQLEQAKAATDMTQERLSEARLLQPAIDYRQRTHLSQFLGALPGPQFDQLVFILSPPPGQIPPNIMPQSNRAIALLKWAESPIGCGLSAIMEILQASFNFVLNR